MAPVGTRVIILEDHNNRGTWSPHGVRGFYVGPAMDHYRSFKILVEDTRRIRITDSVSWHPKEPHDFSPLPTEAVEPPPLIDAEPWPTPSSVETAIPPPTLAPVSFLPVVNLPAQTLNTSLSTAEPRHSPPASSPDEPPLELEISQCTTVESSSQASVAEAPRRTSGRRRKPNPRYDDGMYRFAGIASSFKSACRGDDRDRWLKAADEEFDRLIKTTETMKLIPWSSKPHGRKVSYYNPQIRIKIKADGSSEYRVRGTYGGDISDYQGPTAAQTADMVSIKVLLNATVSEGARFITADIKDFYLGTPMEVKEYMRIHLTQIPPESRAKYVREGLVKDEHVLAEVSKGIYGLKQAGLLAQQKLMHHLKKHGYTPISSATPCLFKHQTRNVVFSLVVDDFGIKFKLDEDANHLIEVLRMEYTVKDDWLGSQYVGFKIQHNREEGKLSLSMPGYLKEAASRFEIDTSVKVDNPMAPQTESGEVASASSQQQKRLQQIIGVLLYYARAVDPTILTRVSKLSTQQKDPTVATLKAAERALQYLVSQQEASITFCKSDMRLICYSDASYLGETRSRSRCGGMFFLGGHDISALNGPILSRSSVIDVVTASAAESELAAAFMNAKEVAYMRHILQAMGYPQHRTPIITDNSFVFTLTNGTCNQKRSRSMDMRFNWLEDRVAQNQFEVIWCKGHINIADHLTKDLPTNQLKMVRELLVESGIGDTSIRSVLQMPDYSRGSRKGPSCEVRGVCSSQTEKSPEDTSQLSSSLDSQRCSLFQSSCSPQPDYLLL